MTLSKTPTERFEMMMGAVGEGAATAVKAMAYKTMAMSFAWMKVTTMREGKGDSLKGGGSFRLDCVYCHRCHCMHQCSCCEVAGFSCSARLCSLPPIA